MGTRAGALLLHFRGEAVAVDGQPGFAGHLFLFVEGQAISIVELKRDRAGNRCAGEAGEFIVEDFFRVPAGEKEALDLSGCVECVVFLGVELVGVAFEDAPHVTGVERSILVDDDTVYLVKTADSDRWTHDTALDDGARILTTLAFG